MHAQLCTYVHSSMRIWNAYIDSYKHESGFADAMGYTLGELQFEPHLNQQKAYGFDYAYVMCKEIDHERYYEDIQLEQWGGVLGQYFASF